MDEEKEIKEERNDDGKIHFPLSGLFIISGIILLMVVCIILIFIFK